MSLATTPASQLPSSRRKHAFRLAALFPDGVGIRNFVHGGFLNLLSQEAEVLALHSMPPERVRELVGRDFSAADWQPILEFRDRASTQLLRKCLSFAQLYWVNTPSMRRERERRIVGAWRHRAVNEITKLVGRCLAFPKGIQWLDHAHRAVSSRQPAVADYRRMLQDFRPDVLFCSHQRPNNVIAPVLAARSLGIPTATFIFSWDNLTSKGRIAAPFDHFLVWSDHMREELLRYYPEVNANCVHNVGTPQFDPYGDASLEMSRQEFFSLFGGDSGRKLICFSGGVPETHMADTYHVRDLLELIRAHKIAGNPQVLVRPAPVDLTERFAKLRESYPELIVAQPEWIGSGAATSWDRVIPHPSDMKFLCNLTRHADVNVNFGSTMTLDFAIHDRPVVNVVYDVANPPLLGMPLWDFVRLFDHYRPVIELGAARFAHSADELASHVNAYLLDPSLDRQNRKQFVDLEVSFPIGSSSPRIVEVLRQIAKDSGAIL